MKNIFILSTEPETGYVWITADIPRDKHEFVRGNDDENIVQSDVRFNDIGILSKNDF